MSQESGWYDDPQDPDYLRYFDGVEWTEHRAPKAPPRLQQQPQPPVASVPPSGASPYAPPGAGTYRAPGYPPAAPERPTTEDGQELASWGRRAGALILDGLLLALVLAPFVAQLAPDYFGQVQSMLRSTSAGSSFGPDDVPTVGQTEAIRVTVAMLALFLVYDVTCLAIWGRTLGRAATGISVRRVEAPQKAPVSRLVLRTLVKRMGDVVPPPLGSLFLLVNYLFPLWDRPLRQALHDKAARTCVVRGRLPRG